MTKEDVRMRINKRHQQRAKARQQMMDNVIMPILFIVNIILALIVMHPSGV